MNTPTALARTGGLRKLLLSRWRIVLLVLLVGLLYAPVLVGLIADWYKDPDYSHGFFVPLISGYLINQKRAYLRAVPQEPSIWGLLVLLGSLGLLFLGTLGAEFFLARISLVITIVALVLYFRGVRQLRVLVFPLAFLVVMIPLPAIIYNQIVSPLQLVTSQVATTTLENVRLFPIMREGNLLITGRYTVEVVQACSGVRSLISLMALALGYGYLAERTRVVRVLLAAFTVPLAILGNAVRVCTQVMLAHYFGVTATEGLWHSLLGLLGFVSAAGLVLVLHRFVLIARRYFETQKRVGVGIAS